VPTWHASDALDPLFPVQSSPVLDDTAVLYLGTRLGLQAVNTSVRLPNGTFAVLWTFTADDPVVQASPAVVGGVVIVATKGYVYGLNRTTGARLWDFDCGGAVVVSSPAVSSDGGVVYLGTLSLHVHALSTATGAEIWVFKKWGRVMASPAVGAWGIVFAVSYDGGLVSIDSRSWPSHLTAVEVQVGCCVVASPVVGHSVVLVGTSSEARQGRLYAMNASNVEQVVWQYPLASMDPIGGIVASPALDQSGVTYAATLAGTVVAIDASGSLKWTWESGSRQPILGSPVLSSEGLLFVASSDGCLYSVVSATGALQCSTCALGNLSSTPLLSRPDLLFLLGNGTLFAITGVLECAGVSLSLIALASIAPGDSGSGALLSASHRSLPWNWLLGGMEDPHVCSYRVCLCAGRHRSVPVVRPSIENQTEGE
jgi:outer membrane protein assembly factor BamB